jgi:hypothetical protein
MIPEPYRGNPAAVTAIVLAGREVGLPPMRALGQSFMVNGKVGILAEAQRGLILAAGHSLEFKESTGTICTMRGRRRGTEYWHTVTWTKDMARAAGIIDGRNRRTWERYPRQMLKARCTAELARDLFADVIGGYQAAEEMDADLATVYTPDTAEPEPAGDHTVVRRQTPVRGRVPTPKPIVYDTNGNPTTLPTPFRGTVRTPNSPAAAPESHDSATNHTDGTPNPTDVIPTRTDPSEPPLPGDPGFDQLVDETGPHTLPKALQQTVAGPDAAGEGGTGGMEPEPGPATTWDGLGVAPTPATQRDTSDWAATRPQIARIVIMFDEYGISDRADRLDMTSRIAGRTLTSANDLTRKEAGQVIDVLTECARQDNPLQALDDLLLTLIHVAADDQDEPPDPA